MKDSGTRQDFDTGAVRDTADDKPRPDLISPFALERFGEWLKLGAQKYDDRNWEKGIPNSRHYASLWRHLLAYGRGETDEDHLAAVLFNCHAIMHNEEMIQRGVLPKSLDDMPDYGAASAPEGESLEAKLALSKHEFYCEWCGIKGNNNNQCRVGYELQLAVDAAGGE